MYRLFDIVYGSVGKNRPRGGTPRTTNAFLKICCRSGHVETMRSAFRKVCDALRLSCDANDPMTDLIVMKIIDLAKAGEIDSVASAQGAG
jgi:pentatricopeptide repeat protein